MDTPHMLDVERLETIQRGLSRALIIEDHFRKPIRRISGVDVAYSNGFAVAACVTLDYQTLRVIDGKTATVEVDFPYKSTYLWFREGPAMLRVVQAMGVESDVFMINGHGIAHPRRFGSASHFGVLTGRPSIGVAGSMLCGGYVRKPASFGEREPITFNGDVVGWLIKPAVGGPIYVSPGHMVSLESAAEIASKCLLSHRFPEPIYLAHRLARAKISG
ncbi:MAG: endonuclease V [Candidatus Bathyarchaeia archaeon]